MERAEDLESLDHIEHQAFRLRPRRTTIRDLHGPWLEAGPCWPDPYRHPIGSPGMVNSLSAPVLGAPTERWEHGSLVEVASVERLEELRERWGARRTRDAVVGQVEALDLRDSDREAMARFCKRGWLRTLVHAFEHVGAKATHVGLDADRLRQAGTLGVAIQECRRRPRLAVLEDLLSSRGGDAPGLFAELDRLEQTFDEDLGDSWLLGRLPDHCASLRPMRNLARLADRNGVLLRDVNWQEFEGENTYAPECPVLAIEPRIYGGGVEHDITHSLEPVFWTRDRLSFEVANNGIEGDGQAMNNLILASRYSGPIYEGFAGWPGAKLFEWLERAFQVATFPQMFGALRTFTIVLHKSFTGDPVEKLRELAPDVQDGPHLQDLLAFFPEYVQHDHDFLGVLHARYVTAFYDRWREEIGARLTYDLERHVQTADDFLWEHQDVDLRTWWHPLIGDVGNARARCRQLWSRALELWHLVDAHPELEAHTVALSACLETCATLLRGLDEAAEGLEALAQEVPPAERDASALELIARDVEGIRERLEALARSVSVEAQALRGPASDLPTPVSIPRDFQDSYSDLFRGVYYSPAIHEGTDLQPSGISLDGARLQVSR